MAKQTGGPDLLTLAMRRAHAEAVSMPDGAGVVSDRADVPVELDQTGDEAPAEDSHAEASLQE